MFLPPVNKYFPCPIVCKVFDSTIHYKHSVFESLGSFTKVNSEISFLYVNFKSDISMSAAF